MTYANDQDSENFSQYLTLDEGYVAYSSVIVNFREGSTEKQREKSVY